MMNELAFTDGIYGSQVGIDNANRDKGPGLPGMEHLREDAIMSEGIEMHEDIPSDMEFIPSSVPDGHIEFYTGKHVCCSSVMLLVFNTILIRFFHLYVLGQRIDYEIIPFCMGFEDYYAAFTKDSSPVFRIVDGAVGRMDQRGGESSWLTVVCENNGQEGPFEGTIVVNLPDDGSKLTHTVKAINGY
jgi:hypothetical protein